MNKRFRLQELPETDMHRRIAAILLALCLVFSGQDLWATNSPITFKDMTQAAGLAMKPRAKHPDARIAKGQKNFKDVYAKGYFLKVQDICILDVNLKMGLILF